MAVLISTSSSDGMLASHGRDCRQVQFFKKAARQGRKEAKLGLCKEAAGGSELRSTEQANKKKQSTKAQSLTQQEETELVLDSIYH